MTDLTHIQDGDTVYVRIIYPMGQEYAKRTARVTKTQVVAGSYRFRRDDGRRIGGNVYSPHVSLIVDSPEVQAGLALREARDRIADMTRREVLQSYTLAQLDAAIRALGGVEVSDD